MAHGKERFRPTLHKRLLYQGAVDYFYGGGDVLAESCTFYNVRSGSVIVAPSHENPAYGYAFRQL